MGCVHGKLCCRRQASSDDEAAYSAADSGAAHRRINGHDGHVLTQNALGSAAVPSHGFRLQYSFLTQRGHYPDTPDRENQDAFCIRTQLQGNPNLHFFGVFDGHGQFGTQCSNFVRERLVELLSDDPHLSEDPVKAYNSAFHATNTELHESEIEDSMSGTTAITVLVRGDTLFVANVGDSRAVAGVWNGNSVVAEDLSDDQTPFRRDEYERVKLCGARVLSVDQVEGIKDPSIQSWGDEESDEADPPRLWVQDGMYPGTAFTRSVGDLTAEKIGVTADPEVLTVKITPYLLFFVVASDGVFEFLSSQAVVNMVAKYADPRDACSAIAADSYRIWLEHESRTDDITIIIVQIKYMCNSGAGATGGENRANGKPSLLVAEKVTAERFVFSGSEVCYPGRGIISDLQGYPLDVSIERSTACVASSPTHPMPLQTVKNLGNPKEVSLSSSSIR